MDDTPSKSDLARIDRMKDEDIDYSDIPPLDEAFLAQPTVQWPPMSDDAVWAFTNDVSEDVWQL